jgi:hypothetical protein
MIHGSFLRSLLYCLLNIPDKYIKQKIRYPLGRLRLRDETVLRKGFGDMLHPLVGVIVDVDKECSQVSGSVLLLTA